LAAEAAAALVGHLAAHALSSRAVLDGTGLFAGRVGKAVADPALTLVDDGGDPTGLPFPCDLAGFAKRRLALVEAGVLSTPAVDDALAAATGLPPTAHAAGADEARPQHLFLAPGDAAPGALLAAAGGGLWIGELFEPGPAHPGGGLRAIARNVRRIAGGALAAPLPDLVWEADLAALLAGPLLAGTDPLALATPDGVGAWSSPSLALPPAGRFHPLP
ncbi:MAG TPA: metallopeptidase TldD-related protein, partial [Thermoanaerobaculia bacterium]|nr:metallopeptidase TldD-related protein [Thermoanaerobaculia bacterium]